jgi:hypothetical protein
MSEEAWLTFPEAVQIVRNRFGTSIGRAEASVLAARKSKEVRAKPSREPFYLIGDDGLNPNPDLKAGRFSRDDFLDWLDRHEPRSAPASPTPTATPQRRQAASPVRDRAKQAIDALWPTGVPPVTVLRNGPLCAKVCNWIKSDCDKRGEPYVAPSNDTILRAAGRK